jgi:hypothetical protein
MARRCKYGLYKSGLDGGMVSSQPVEFPSVTTIDCRDKSAQLMAWAVNTMANYLKEEYTNIEDKIKADDNAIDPELYYYNTVDNAKNNYRKLSTEAAGIGTEVHAACEKFVKDGELTEEFSCVKAENSFNAFIEWSNENVECYLESERVVFCEEHGYAGCLDAIALMKSGRILLLDFKTSKAFYDSMCMQLAAYLFARIKMSGEYKFRDTDGNILTEEYEEIKIDGAAIVRLDKETGMPEFKEYTEKIQRQYDAYIMLVHFFYQVSYRMLKNNPWVISNY